MDKLYYLVTNNFDGSASVEFFTSKEVAEKILALCEDNDTLQECYYGNEGWVQSIGTPYETYEEWLKNNDWLVGE